MVGIKEICRTVLEMYLFADSVKKIHYSTDSSHAHELCDEVRDTINNFADTLAEQMFGYIGKPSFSDFPKIGSLEIPENDDLCKVCSVVSDRVDALRSDIKGDAKLTGTVSLIDDFKGDMQKLSFLCTFDKVAGHRNDV